MYRSGNFSHAVRLITIVLILGFTAVLFAAAKGSETKGKAYFKQTCKQCHVKGQPGGELTPMSKTQGQWKAIFEKGKHPKDKQPLAGINGMDDQKINDVYAFLYNHAADSPQPETCGK